MLESNEASPNESKYSALLGEDTNIDIKSDPALFEELMFMIKQSPSSKILILFLTSVRNMSHGLMPLNF